jgi:hypothetical protein
MQPFPHFLLRAASGKLLCARDGQQPPTFCRSSSLPTDDNPRQSGHFLVSAGVSMTDFDKAGTTLMSSSDLISNRFQSL